MRFVYAEPEVIGPNICRVIARNPSAFTLYGTSTYILGDLDGNTPRRPAAGIKTPLAIIDPGPQLDEHIDALLKTIAGRPVSHIFVTHTHRDHSPAAAALKAATGAKTYAFGPHPTGRAEDGGGAPVENGPDLDFVPDVRLTDGQILHAGGHRVEVVHTPGHMSNHLCFALPDAGILFSGDHVMGWATSVISPPDGSLCAYMASLAKVRDRAETRYWPSHGPAIDNPKRLVQAYLDHRDNRSMQILSCLQQGAETIPQIVDLIYEGLRDDLVAAAQLSVLAHLQSLAAQGFVTSGSGRLLRTNWRLLTRAA